MILTVLVISFNLYKFPICKYAGKWYNVERAGILYEYAVQCATATYECADGCKKLQVLNAGVTSIGDFKFNRTGVATGRPDAPNSLAVYFDNGTFFWKFKS